MKPGDVCSHIWIDPAAAPIHRRPLSPTIGPMPNELKPGRRYQCANCRAILDTPVLTDAAISEMQRGGHQLAPGVWVDRAGAMHFSIPDVLAHFGLPDTPANRNHATALLQKMLAGLVPEARITVKD